MFLTQEQTLAGISADSTLAVETSSQVSVWQKIAVFQEIETSWRYIGCLPIKPNFRSINSAKN
jgi:hypothetical protein